MLTEVNWFQTVARIAVSLVPPIKGITNENVSRDTTFDELGFEELDLDTLFQELEELDDKINLIPAEQRVTLKSLGAVTDFLEQRASVG